MSFKLITEGGDGDTRLYRKRQFIPDCRSRERERSSFKVDLILGTVRRCLSVDLRERRGWYGTRSS